MTYRYTLILLITLSMACSGSDTEGEGDNTGLTAQEELCANYPENIQCPTLPEPPQPPTLEDGTDFSSWTPKDCPPGYMAEFGKDNCISIGDPCPQGDWPENLPTSNVKYVTPGGTGDGSSPQNAAGSIQAMLNVASSGATIALSKGTFNEAVEVVSAQHIIGACARDTVIQGPPGSDLFDTTVFFSGVGDASLKNVTVTGDRIGILVLDIQNPITISGVIIEAAKGFGLFMQNGQAEIDRMIIQNTQSSADGTGGWGIGVQHGAILTLSQALLSGNREVGMYVSNAGTTVTASDVVIENTQSSAGDTGGRGINVQDGSTLSLSRALLDGNRDVGMQVVSVGVGANVIASDLVIQNTQSRADGTRGRGIGVEEGSTLSLSHALLSGNRDVGMYVASVGTTVTASDVVIENTQSRADGTGGRGIEAISGSTLALSHALLSGNRDVGMLVGDAGTTVTASDVVIENTQSEADGTGGRGINVQDGANLTLSQALLSGNRDVGMLVLDAGTTVTASDIVIENTQSEADGTDGRGIEANSGSTLALSHALLSGNRDVGMLVGDAGTTVTASDVVIENTQSVADGTGGRGMSMQEGASLNLSRSLLFGNREVGMVVSNAGTTVTASDVVIENTKVAACEEDPLLDCPFAGEGWGDGMLVIGGADISLNNFTLQDNARVGLYLYDVTGLDDASLGDITGAPTITAENGNIINNQYGINIRGDSVTPSDLINVACYDNEKTVDGCYSDQELSVPDPSSMMSNID